MLFKQCGGEGCSANCTVLFGEGKGDLLPCALRHVALYKQDTPLATQVGGDHYRKLAIQPVEYLHANKLGFFEGSVVKYVTRWRDKGGIADLKKARHLIDILIELEGRSPSA